MCAVHHGGLRYCISYAICEVNKHFAKSKHIDRRDLFIRELVERGIVTPKYIPTAKNIADALTKPLEKGIFMTHRAAIMGHA